MAAGPRIEPSPQRFASPNRQATRLFASAALPSDSSNSSLRPTDERLARGIRTIITPELLREVHAFWFEHLSGPDAFILPGPEDSKRWFFGGETLDKQCVERFAPTLDALRASGVKSGHDIISALQPSSANEWLSLLILLDQISRNCYRGEASSHVFTVFDPIAKDIALSALERGIPHEWPEIRWQFASRSWFYLPLMHSEDRATHEMVLREYERMAQDVESLIEAKIEDGDGEKNEYRARATRAVQGREEEARKYGQLNWGFEKRHWDIIQRFGRYPHRNKAMGRETTAEEKEYLENGGETFGG
ncbi:hypothetical protein PT974_08121 [Cladobotryum mycophilum]|uniref:DUF924-domain-containing protein n=1 Tax=Cladobotryum mycophilum TaxID=491253 RepID=A0ABR0SCI0_9HYPO